MADRRAYLHLNPFVSTAVPEDTFWQPDAEFYDVGSIHRLATERLRSELAELEASPTHSSRVLFVVGGPGSGKSHLFSRLRRGLAHGEVFAFAANPPTRPQAIEAWILERVVSGMCRRLGRRFTQLQGFLYALVLSGGEAPGANLDQLHDYWHGVSRRSRQKFLGRLKGRLSEAGHWDPVLLPVLLDVLDPEKEDAAVAWLSGAANLSDEQLQLVSQGGPNERVLGTLLSLGQLARIAARPIVLVLDQLDQMLSRDHVAEFDRLLIALHDNSRGWFITVGLTREPFDAWRTHLSTPFVDRFLTDTDAVIGLDPIRPADKRALVAARLTSPPIAAQREADGVNDALFPLSEADLDNVAQTAGDYPRSVIIRARERFRTQCLQAAAPPQPPSLDDILAREFDEALARIVPDALLIDKSVLADRLAEVVEAVCAADSRTCARAVGDLEQLPRFRGTDTALTVDGRTIRIVGHHVQQGRQFPDFLRQVLDLSPPAVLVRDGAVATSGSRTIERLATFKRDKTFLHLSRSHAADAYALGHVLAAIREGNFDDVVTEPAPTRETLVAAAGRLTPIHQHPIVTAVMEALAGLQRTVHTEVTPVPPAIAPRPDDRHAPAAVREDPVDERAVEQAIVAIMRRERWLVLERLRRELARAYTMRVGASRLRRILGRDPIRTQLTCHPANILEPADLHILIWAGD
jgi:hypothetical protein